MNQEQFNKVLNADGFIAALDQSGGSTPKALAAYGVEESTYNGEDEMYEAALQANSYWFPDTYLMLAKYFEGHGTNWANVDPKEVLGAKYSSGQGYSKILEEMKPTTIQRGAGCSV